MNFVPYDFINCVAHILSTDSLGQLGVLNADLWENVCLNHLNEREEYVLTVWMDDEGMSAILEAKYAEEVYSSREFLKKINPYTRISEIFVFKENYEEYSCSKSDLERLLQIFQDQQIKELYVSHKIETHQTASLESLWKRPVKRLWFSRLSSTVEFLNYHMLENKTLEEIEVHGATYEFMRNLTESAEKGKSQEQLSEQADFGLKTLADLSEVGFMKVDDKYQDIRRCSAVTPSKKIIIIDAFE
ncbi:hypothetical protein L596_009883 [Steinernema carpocapsae]|uniref:Uncharacterized protein n=1 Tax=Steinernema carpocapsae TaxID=34508 RepID=A0A4U5PGM1_STECR|nr:hypothetical protein L596_009883 [Steinernema carpocapsae]